MDFNRQMVQYTITEGIKIFELALANPSNSRGAVFWLQVEQKGIIPRRPGESMRNFWKIHTHQGLEAYLARAVKDEHRYCHAFKRIPQVETGLENMSVSQTQDFQRIKNAAEKAERVKYNVEMETRQGRSRGRRDKLSGLFRAMEQISKDPSGRVGKYLHPEGDLDSEVDEP